MTLVCAPMSMPRIEETFDKIGDAPGVLSALKPGLTTQIERTDWRAAMNGTSPCTIEGCDRSQGPYRDYCRMHYVRIAKHGDAGQSLPQRDLYSSAEVKFWRRVNASGVCWEWEGAIKSDGYGAFSPSRGVWEYPHRWAWEYLIGPIPELMTIDHRCLNRVCVNPDHLEVVTRSENSLRANSYPTRAPRKKAA